MNKEIRNLGPKAVWNKFADLNAVPRPSKKEERVRKFMRDFGESLNLETLEDDKGNVVIRKPATQGMENKKKLVLQAHLDMVHQKNKDTDFDFSTEGIKMYVDGDWVRAEGTTLGADNGYGVASIMAILESEDLPHPDLEALFTVDEEAGMTGAKALDNNILEGDILLNLDTEEDDEINIGCAGGVDITAVKHYKGAKPGEGTKSIQIVVKGLNGGHSGMDIEKGRGNANVFMARILYEINTQVDVRLACINAGGLRNAIPRESIFEIVFEESDWDKVKSVFGEVESAIKNEYSTLEKNLEVSYKAIELPDEVLTVSETSAVIKALRAVHNGVYRMDPDVENLVQTSNNIARVELSDGKVEAQCLTRSSVDSSKDDLAAKITAAFELGGFDVKQAGEYPGWQPNPDSDILKVADRIYKDQNGEKAKVMTVHAGLECGILSSIYPDMDMISFGPTILGAHSPDERVSISSTQKYWKFLLEILQQVPEKQ